MVENINLQKITFPASSPKRLKALDQRQGHTHERCFKRHLEDEEGEDKKKNKEDRHLNDNSDVYISEQKKHKAGIGDQQGHITEITKTENRRLNLIDIVV